MRVIRQRAGARDDHLAVAANETRGQSGRHVAGRDNGEIEFTVQNTSQQRTAILFEQAEFDLWKTAFILLQRRGQDRTGQRRDQPEPDQPGDVVVHLGQVGLQCQQRTDDGLTFAIYNLPGGRQAVVLAGPVQQRCAKLQFEVLNLRGHARLGRVFPLGGLGKGLCLVNGEERTQAVDTDFRDRQRVPYRFLEYSL